PRVTMGDRNPRTARRIAAAIVGVATALAFSLAVHPQPAEAATLMTVSSESELAAAFAAANAGDTVTASLTSNVLASSTAFSLTDGVLVIELGSHTLSVTGPTASAAAVAIEPGAVLRFVGTGSVLLQGAAGATGDD